MGKSTLTCGCESDDIFEENMVYVRRLDKIGDVCLSYECVCDDCLKLMKKHKVIIDNPDKFLKNYKKENKNKKAW